MEREHAKTERKIDQQLHVQKAWIEDVAKRLNPFNEREITFLKQLHSKKWKELHEKIEQFQDEMYNELLDHELDSPDRRNGGKGFDSEESLSGKSRKNQRR